MLLTQEKDREEMNDQLENAGLEADVGMLHCYFAANAFVQRRNGIEQKTIKWPAGATWPLFAALARTHCKCCKGEGVG